MTTGDSMENAPAAGLSVWHCVLIAGSLIVLQASILFDHSSRAFVRDFGRAAHSR
jgi:hypothetical protein